MPSNFVMILQLTPSDKISLAAVLISAVSLVVAVVTYIIKSNKEYKANIEAIRPNVFISYEKETSYTLFNERLILKNYGKTTAWIDSITINPPFKNKNNGDLMPNTLSTINNFPLAPGQELSTLIGVAGAEDNTIEKANREYIIKYMSEDRKQNYISKYTVNEKGNPILLSIDKSRDVIEIRDAIKKISEKLSSINESIGN